MKISHRHQKLIAATMMPVLAALVVLALGLRVEHKVETEAEKQSLWGAEQSLVFVNAGSATDLERIYEDQSYQWFPTANSVPGVAVHAIPRDVADIKAIARRKALFFRALLPVVLAEQANIRRQRGLLNTVINMTPREWGIKEREWLYHLMSWYRVDGDPADTRVQIELLARVDEIPVALVLAQAANESAWGTSRFAIEGNNLFGLWTYDESQGIIPKGRPAGKTYAVKAFPTILESVREYMRNLNTNDAYRTFRDIRVSLRQRGQLLHADLLVEGLVKYSSRGKAYVRDIRSMIEKNELLRLPQLDIHPVKMAALSATPVVVAAAPMLLASSTGLN